MTEDEAMPVLVRHWLQMADDALASARSELDASRLHFAVNRLYYACFYAVTALMQSEDRQITIRMGVDIIDYFKQLAVETGIPYQKLINMYLRSCVVEKKRPVLEWVS